MSDGEKIDSGMAGFQAIFGADAAGAGDAPAPARAETPPDGRSAEPISDTAQFEATSADTAAPEDTDDGQYTSADDVVAARLAASLEADASSVPDPDETDDEEASDPVQFGGEELDLENLTPEQLKNILEQMETLRTEKTQNDRHAIAQKVIAAEQSAVQSVWQEFEQQVVTKSERHYNAELLQRVSKAYDQHETQPNPKQWLLGQIAAETAAVNASRQQWEGQQQTEYEQRATQAAIAARKHVPELRQLYAEELATEFTLPKDVVPYLLKVADTDNFRAEAERIASLAEFAAKERTEKNDEKRKQANQKLREQRVRTPTTARPVGGKAPAYKGTWAEGARILSLLSEK